MGSSAVTRLEDVQGAPAMPPPLPTARRTAPPPLPTAGRTAPPPLPTATAIPAAAQRVRLEVVQGVGPGRTIDLTSARTRIGRSPANDLSISDSTVSGRHCDIERVDDRYYLVDVGSEKGTLVNDQPTKRKELVAGDLIRLGSTVLAFGPPMEFLESEEMNTVYGLDISRFLERSSRLRSAGSSMGSLLTTFRKSASILLIACLGRLRGALAWTLRTARSLSRRSANQTGRGLSSLSRLLRIALSKVGPTSRRILRGIAWGAFTLCALVGTALERSGAKLSRIGKRRNALQEPAAPSTDAAPSIADR